MVALKVLWPEPGTLLASFISRLVNVVCPLMMFRVDRA